MNSIYEAFYQAKEDAKNDWDNDTIKDEFDESTNVGKCYARTYCEEIKRLSVSHLPDHEKE